MTLHYVTPRPAVYTLESWDGDNQPEILAFLQTNNPSSTATVNEDGTLTTTGGVPGHPFTVEVGGTFDNRGVPTAISPYFQELPDNSPNYVIG